MSQIFRPSANSIARASIIGVVLVLVLVVGAGFVYIRSPYNTGRGIEVVQPIQFSHRHHVGDVGIDCRYCHTSAESSAFAGIPPTATCMNCHSQLWNTAPILEPVRQSFATGQPLQWNRVYKLADFVYFDHSAHLAKGVGCTTCHGQMDEMALTYQQPTLLMSWCIDCHTAPDKYLRPLDQVFNVAWRPPSNQREVGRGLVQKYQVNARTDCSTCHR